MNGTMKNLEVTPRSGNRQEGKRLDEFAMALVLIMTGALWLAPKAMFPEGTWLAGAGMILLGLNAARRIHGVETRGFGIILGLIALAGGIGRIIGREIPMIPILLISLGAGLVVGAARGKRTSGMPDAS